MLSLLHVFPLQHASTCVWAHDKLHCLQVLHLSLSGGRVEVSFMHTFWISLITWIWKCAQRPVPVPDWCSPEQIFLRQVLCNLKLDSKHTMLEQNSFVSSKLWWCFCIMCYSSLRVKDMILSLFLLIFFFHSFRYKQLLQIKEVFLAGRRAGKSLVCLNCWRLDQLDHINLITRL